MSASQGSRKPCLADLVNRAREESDFSDLIAAIPYANFLGVRVELRAGELIGVLGYSDHLVGNPTVPALHGGTIGALLESTSIFQVLWQADTLVLPKTINLTIDYLRSARPEDTFCHGVITKHGRRVVNVRAIAYQSDRDRPVASANAHFLVEPRD